MAQLVTLVVIDLGKVDDVVHAWVEARVSGLTILDSSGLAHHAGEHGLRDDVPLFPSVRRLLRETETQSRTMFSVVPDDFDVEALIDATERVIGSLDEEKTGILFVLPLTRVAGLKRRGGPMEAQDEESRH